MTHFLMTDLTDAHAAYVDAAFSPDSLEGVILARSQTPVFPDRPYIVWHWNVNTGLHLGHYDLTQDYAYRVFGGLVSISECSWDYVE